MTDPDLVLKKLARIETCVQELRTLARPEEIGRDIREERFVEHTLQIGIQAAIDVASHIISEGRLGEPETQREMFEILRRAAWLPDELAARLAAMAGFRNVLVHGYDRVDAGIVRDLVEHRLGDLLEFAAAVRRRILPARG